MISCHEILFFEFFLSSLNNIKICSLVGFFFSPTCCTKTGGGGKKKQKWVVVICRPLPLEYVCLSGWEERESKWNFFSSEWSQPAGELVTKPHRGSREFHVSPKCVFWLGVLTFLACLSSGLNLLEPGLTVWDCDGSRGRSGIRLGLFNLVSQTHAQSVYCPWE